MRLSRNQVDAFFGSPLASPSWSRTAETLAAKMPARVFEAARAAELVNVRAIPTVLTSRNTHAVFAAFRAMVPMAAVAAGVIATNVAAPFMLLAPVAGALAACLPARRDPAAGLVAKLVGGVVKSNKQGHVSPKRRALDLYVPLLAREDMAPTASHELMHVIDAACGDVSASERFMALYNAVLDTPETAPRRYSRKSARELFADACAAYVGLGCIAPEELRARNPELYAFAAWVIDEELPRRLGDGSIRMSDTWRSDDAFEMTLQHPLLRATHAAAELGERLLQLAADDPDVSTNEALSREHRRRCTEALATIRAGLDAAKDRDPALGMLRYSAPTYERIADALHFHATRGETPRR